MTAYELWMLVIIGVARVTGK